MHEAAPLMIYWRNLINTVKSFARIVSMIIDIMLIKKINRHYKKQNVNLFFRAI